MDTSVCANVATTVYAIPAEPGPYAHHGTCKSAAEQAGVNAIHKEGRRIYNLYENVNATFKQEIIVVVEDIYLTAKKQWYMGFHSISSKNLVEHRMERYGKIWASDLKACRQALAEPIEVDHLSDVYFQRVEDAIQFAHDRNKPFTQAETG